MFHILQASFNMAFNAAAVFISCKKPSTLKK